MAIRTGKTVPYEDKEQIKQAMAYLAENCDLTYLLIFKVALFTGLRISDILSLRYDKNLKDDYIVLVESKSFKQAQARAKLRVLNRAKETLAHICDDKAKLTDIMFTKPKDIYPLLTDGLKKQIDIEIEREVAAVNAKKHYCKIPKTLIDELKKRKHQYKNIDKGFVFATATLKTNIGKRTKPTIDRITVWKIFKRIGEQLDFDFNTACHQLRKTFAVMLYKSSGKDGALVVKTVGWQDDKLLQTYLSIGENEPHIAVSKMQDELLK